MRSLPDLVNRSTMRARAARGMTTLAAVICIVASPGACGGAYPSAGGTHTIEIDRQVWLGGIEGRPTAITKLSDGGFAIAGHLSTGWVVATDAQGEIRWKYVAPLDENLILPSPAFPHSEFHGLVPLANGNILLCGQKYTNVHKTVAMITILSSTGQLLEERAEFTNGDEDFTTSSIDHCIRWNDGVVLTGSKRNKVGATQWMMKLDGNGANQWQKEFTSDAALFNPAIGADRSLVAAQISWNPAQPTANAIKRLNEKGETIATSAPMKGDYQYILRAVGVDKGVAIIDSYHLSNTYRLYALGERLEQTEEPRQLRIINLQEGFGFRLPDRSLVLFGSTITQYGGRGAIDWIAPNGDEMAVVVLRQILNGVTFGDAVPLPNNQFVVVASQNAYASRTHGLFMSWITLH
jgi:hypothetical protein